LEEDAAVKASTQGKVAGHDLGCELGLEVSKERLHRLLVEVITVTLGELEARNICASFTR
jgi:hypothetical protein